jgi:hypothetical protein
MSTTSAPQGDLDLTGEAKAAGPVAVTQLLSEVETHLPAGVKAGIKTTELWLLVAANALVNLGAIDVGSAKVRGYLLIASSVGYAISRGLAKLGVKR